MSDLFKQIQKNKKPPQIPQKGFVFLVLFSPNPYKSILKGEDSGSDDEEENKDNFVSENLVFSFI